MAWIKRIGLFVLTNILIMVTISIILNILGVGSYMAGGNLQMGSLLVFCLVWGMTGSFISLLMSKQMAKWTMGVKIIDPNTMGGTEGEIVQMVRRLSAAANIPMPEVGIYESPEVNAFATGPTKKRSLVAVSTGLLRSMNRNEVEGVIAHEVSHISNGDMVTMVLIQGIVNSFAMFLSRIISYGITMVIGGSRDEEGEGFGGTDYLINMVLTIVFDIVFTILGSIAVSYFSRKREFKADLGSARIAGKDKMIAALQSLQRGITGPVDNRGESMASLKISTHKKGFLHLFSTHPSLEDRIAALQKAAIM